MQTVRLSFAASLEYKPPHPERTAWRSRDWDREYKTWNARAPMVRAIRMQEQRAGRSDDWRAVVPLREIEGY